MKNFIIHVKEALNHAHPQKCPFWQHIKQETNIKKEKKSSCQVISEAVTSCIPFAICCQTDLSIYHGPGFFQLSHDLPSVNCCWLLLSDTGLHLCRGTMSLLLSGPSWQQTADVLSPNLSGKRAEDKSDYFSLTYLFLKLDVSFFFLCCGRLVFLGFPNLIIHSVLFLTATAVRNTLKIVNLGTSWKYQDEWKKVKSHL